MRYFEFYIAFNQYFVELPNFDDQAQNTMMDLDMDNLYWVLDSTNNLWERVMERVVQAFNEDQANEKISTISKMSRDRLMRLIRLI